MGFLFKMWIKIVENVLTLKTKDSDILDITPIHAIALNYL